MMIASFLEQSHRKVHSHGAAAAAFFLFFFAATIGLHCNKWSHLHCTAAAATVAVLPHRMGLEPILCGSGIM